MKFFCVTSVNKSSKNPNFYTILGPTVAICVPNMYIKFRKDRSSSFGEHSMKKVVLRKARLKFFPWKIVKKSDLQLISDADTIQNPICFDFFNRFFEVDKLGWSLNL